MVSAKEDFKENAEDVFISMIFKGIHLNINNFY